MGRAKKYGFVAGMVIICMLMNCACSPPSTYFSKQRTSDAIKYSDDELLTMIKSLQQEDGGFADIVIPSLRSQLYDSFYAIKSLELLGYDLNKLNSTKEWLGSIDIQNDLLKREECVVDLLYYVVGSCDSLDIEISLEDRKAIINFLGDLQDEEGYFYGSKAYKEQDAAHKGYQDVDVLTATHTIIQILDILGERPSYIDQLKEYNKAVLENAGDLSSQEAIEIDLVALKIAHLLNDTIEDGQKVETRIADHIETLKGSIEQQGGYNIFQLDALYHYDIMAAADHMKADNAFYLHEKIGHLLDGSGGFYADSKFLKNAQADYIGLKIYKEYKWPLEKGYLEDSKNMLLSKLDHGGFFSYYGSKSSCYSTAYALKAMELLNDDNSEIKALAQKYSENSLKEMYADNDVKAEEGLFVLLLAEQCQIEIPGQNLEREINKIWLDIAKMPIDKQVLCVKYLCDLLKEYDADDWEDQKAVIGKWLMEYGKHKTALTGVESVMQSCYLFSIANVALDKENDTNKSFMAELKHTIYDELSHLDQESWLNMEFVSELLLFCQENDFEITFKNKLPALSEIQAVVSEDLSVVLSNKLLYDMALYQSLLVVSDDETRADDAENNLVKRDRLTKDAVIDLGMDDLLTKKMMNEDYTVKTVERGLAHERAASEEEMDAIEHYLQKNTDQAGSSKKFISEGDYQPYDERVSAQTGGAVCIFPVNGITTEIRWRFAVTASLREMILK